MSAIANALILPLWGIVSSYVEHHELAMLTTDEDLPLTRTADVRFDTAFAESAARAGALHVLRWLWARGGGTADNASVLIAAAGLPLEDLKEIATHCIIDYYKCRNVCSPQYVASIDSFEFYRAAARDALSDKLLWVFDQFGPPDARTIRADIFCYASPAVITAMFPDGYSGLSPFWMVDVSCSRLASVGNLPALQRAHQLGFSLNCAMGNAAYGGHISTMEWLAANHAPVSPAEMFDICLGGTAQADIGAAWFESYLLSRVRTPAP